MTLMHKSVDSERQWTLVHSDLGPYLVGAWYRSPVRGGTDLIQSLREEWSKLSPRTMGIIIIGDMNVHHKRWLWKSSRNSVEGAELHQFCADAGAAAAGS